MLADSYLDELDAVLFVMAKGREPVQKIKYAGGDDDPRRGHVRCRTCFRRRSRVIDEI